MRPEHVTGTPTNGNAVLLSRVSVCVTLPVYWTAIGGSFSHVIRKYVLLISFGMILTQFYVNFSRQEHQIDVLQVSVQLLGFSVFSLYPFYFSFTVT